MTTFHSSRSMAAPRHDWTLDQVEALFDLPFMPNSVSVLSVKPSA